MPHEIEDCWPVLQSYSDALPELVERSIANIDVAIDYFEWLLEQARTGESLKAVISERKKEGKKPLKKEELKKLQEGHIMTAAMRLSEMRQSKETIPRIIEGIQINIELLNMKLLNTKPVVAGAEENGIQLPSAE